MEFQTILEQFLVVRSQLIKVVFEKCLIMFPFSLHSHFAGWCIYDSSLVSHQHLVYIIPINDKTKLLDKLLKNIGCKFGKLFQIKIQAPYDNPD